ncbi:MAG TPA: polyphosphate:AMP phosphotransferase [Candidatus Saccharimonadales bacterium]|nr:polyphosphate:AMP phosphotransferase [Candidatus Saccharimonadales bacterium]
MFETAEVGNAVAKEAFEKEAAGLREDLLAAQKGLASSDRSLVLVIGGVEGGGKTETANLLLEWMDARGIETHALTDPSDEERERPPMWRFWRLLPPHGRMAIFLGSWYTAPIVDRTFHRLKDAAFERELDRIADFERMLGLEGTKVVKIWMHLSKEAQRARFRKLEKSKLTRWRVSKQDWKYQARYDAFRRISEQAIRKTSTGASPWLIVEATDERYRTLTVARALLTALRELTPVAARGAGDPGVGRSGPQAKGSPEASGHAKREVTVLSRLDLTKKLGKKDYESKLIRYQGRLNRLARHLYEKQRSLILAFEGPDAAGKGGSIRRVTAALDARQYRVISVAAPSDEEKARPYLWRFWRALPRRGRITIYDRSWYGRVLVERVEGFAAEAEWKRAYGEINGFEEQLAESGTIILKFWLTISPEEQLERFKDRQTTPYKQYKITEEDWRNRNRWDAYDVAACDMIEKTSTSVAPWIPVEANDKRWARIRVLHEICRHVKGALEKHD